MVAASVRLQVITHASGAFCYLSSERGHSISSAAQLAAAEREAAADGLTG